MNASSRIVPSLVLINLVTLALLAIAVLGATGSAAESSPQELSCKEIRAERINIVSPEGKTVIAICNKQRIAGPAMDAKEYPTAVSEGREHMAGMIFFNDDGDEMGGLIFNSFRMKNGRAAGIGHLSFDRFKDNQVLALRYIENARGVQSGLTIYDRPGDGSFKKSLDLIDEFAEADAARRSEIEKELAALRPSLGAERVFVGSKDKTAQLALKDSKGRVRALLSIGDDDEAKLEFLDEEGKVTARFPEAH